MVSTMQGRGAPRQASFRERCSGSVIDTGCFHDITRLPGGFDVDLDAWEAGFTDCDGRFYTRAEAAALVGVVGRLESESYFSRASNPTLEGGHLEAWRKPGCVARRERRSSSPSMGARVTRARLR